MITCQITNLSQDFDLSDGQQKTYAVLVLPTGKSLRVPVDDDTAASLIALALNGGQTKRAAPVPDYEAPPAPRQELKIDKDAFLRGTTPDGTDTAVFGGEVSATETALMEEVEAKLGGEEESELAAAIRKAQANEKNGGRTRPRLVGVDTAGNPIMEYPNGVDPTKVTGGPLSNSDEDGVQQL